MRQNSDVFFSGGNWKELLEANAIPALVNILKPDKSLLPEEENSVQRMDLKMQTSAVIKSERI